MAEHTGDRAEDRGQRREGDANERVAPDIFEQIAERIFVKRDLPVDPDWVQVIAGEFRGAMAQLDVEVKPKSPEPPKPTRTVNATIMLLLAAVENGDIWIREARIPVRKDANGRTRFTAGIVEFDCGQMEIHVRYDAISGGKEILGNGGIEKIALSSGQIFTANNDDRAWLKHYFPPIALDPFSPAVQRVVDGLDEKARVIRIDSDHRTHHWPGGDYHPAIYKDAKGREL